MATDDPGVEAELHKRLTELGVTSLVAAPIVVSGDIWGAVVVSVTRDEQFAADAEERIGKFAGLVGVTLANTQAREELNTFLVALDEQATTFVDRREESRARVAAREDGVPQDIVAS